MWKISGQRFALAGGSAGGHLALLFSYAFDSEHLIKAVVSLAGPTDLTDTSFHRCAANYRIDYVFRQLLGNDYRDNPALYREASPLFRPDSVPTLLIYGKLDDLVPFAQGLRLFEALSSYGFPADTLFYENAGHNVLGDKNRNASEISARMNRWLKLHLDKN
jgi:dipeptidyl aminopeptidase/acylaminoacyl peptidase